MSSEVLAPAAAVATPPARSRRVRLRRPVAAHTTLLAHGEPMIWLTGGALAVALAMIIVLVGKIVVEGTSTFWPTNVVRITTIDGQQHMGEISAVNSYRPAETLYSSLPADQQKHVVDALAQTDGTSRRRSFRMGNYELTGTHFQWFDDALIISDDLPEWAVVVERLGEIDGAGVGRFYGFPEAFLLDGQLVATTPDEAWDKFQEHFDAVSSRRAQLKALNKHEYGATLRELKAASLDVKQAELDYGLDSAEHQAAAAVRQQVEQGVRVRQAELNEQMQSLSEENARYLLRFRTAGGDEKDIALADIANAYPANQLSFGEKLRVYFSRWREFLFDDPRQANSEGGVFPALWGTVAMTLIMSVMVVPFGVLAALYLREYAKGGPLVSAIRIAINNLAGVPSIVFGVFGLGFFCYVVGASMDRAFFRAELAQSNTPTFGTGGLLWASLTLALLTLPVVIVATEEALAAVPNSMREGSYACGASKWQTIWRIVLPRALPGIITGMILAMARGAGEVAPLMVVGVAKIAPELPVDTVFPYIHPQRSFMHLGFHIYDVAYQSPNSEAAKPMVYTTTLLLIAIVAFLNISAALLRTRLRRRFMSTQF